MATSSAVRREGAPSGARVTFLHTSDWQLGMVRRFLGPEAGARYSQARIDAIERIGALVPETGAAFVVVAGDVFDANQVDRQVVLRACEAMRSIPCPVLLLPGNHDSLEPGTVWGSPTLTAHLPSNVEVLTDSTPRHPVPGAEVVGLPWRSRRVLADPLAEAAALAPPPTGVFRVVVGHGQADVLTPDVGEPALVRTGALDEALHAGLLHYVALGDRHSTTAVGETGRIWYSGTPEPTRPEEDAPGNVLVVELTAEPPACRVRPVRVGTWRLLSHVVDVDGDAALDALAEWLGDQPDKARTVVRLGVRGSLSVAGLTRLEMLLDAHEEVFAAIQRWRRHWTVSVVPDDESLDALPLTGPARSALEELRAATAAGDAQAADALALLHRLAGGVA